MKWMRRERYRTSIENVLGTFRVRCACHVAGGFAILTIPVHYRMGADRRIETMRLNS